MSLYPNADSSPDVVLDWLHDQGWSINHAVQDGKWHVTGTKGSHQIRTIGATLEEAWLHATEQARLHDEKYANAH